MKKLYPLFLVIALLLLVHLSFAEEKWIKIEGSEELNIKTFYPHYSTVVALAGDNFIYQSVDAGPWTRVGSYDLSDYNVIDMAPFDDNYMVLTEDRGILISGDDGSTWLISNYGIEEDEELTGLTYSINYIDYLDLYVWSKSKIYKFDKANNSWDPFIKGLPDDEIVLFEQGMVYLRNNGLYILNNSNRWVNIDYNRGETEVNFMLQNYNEYYIIDSNNMLWYLDNDSWTNIYQFSKSLNINCAIYSLMEVPVKIPKLTLFSGMDILVGTEEKGVYFARHDFYSFEQLNKGLDDLHITDLKKGESHSNVIYAKTQNSGIYYFEVVFESVNDELKQQYSISLGPNPASNNINISYNLASFARVSIDIHDIFGTKLATVVDNDLAAGEYSESFDASDLPSGSYICRFGIDGEFVSERFVVER